MKTSSSTFIVRRFIGSAGSVLFGLALTMILANLSAPGLTRPRDPILGVPMSCLFWGLAGLELALVWVCFFTKNSWVQALVIFWLSQEMIVYWVGLRLDGSAATFSLYLSSLADTFAVSGSFAYSALKAAYLYLFIGSGVCIFWLWREHRASRDNVRQVCNHCGGHITFPAPHLGRTVPCPHCQRTITLRNPGNLTTSCYFCNGHIEFPAHAIGEKLKCPHCRMDITLKEPSLNAKLKCTRGPP